MAFRRRKLATFSPMDPIKFCEENCDPIKTPDSICTEKCIWCPPVCENPPPAIVFTAPTQNPPRISLLLTISISALAAAFFLFTCYAIYKLYSNWCSRRRRSLRREDSASEPDFFPDQDPAVDHHIWYIRTVGLQPSVIGAITIVKYKKGDGLIDGSDCSVCLSEFQEDETLRLLPKCNHAFHVSCIDTWLGAHTNCPICRAGIVNTSDEQIVQDSAPVEELRQGNRDSENELIGPVVGIEDATGSQLHTRIKIDLPDGIQPLRRSISVDSLSVTAKLETRVKDCESGVVVGRKSGFNQGLLRLIGGPSMQIVSTHSMKRSHSCSANVLLSKHGSRNRN